MTKQTPDIFRFQLPKQLACPLPTEERGLRRDDVRLLVSNHDGDQLSHRTFHKLPEILQAGDVLVVNTSATLPAALPVQLPNGRQGRLHLSSELDENRWLVEVRAVNNSNTQRWKGGTVGQRFNLPAEATVQLTERFYQKEQALDLWVAHFATPIPLMEYLEQYAQAVKYQQLQKAYPLTYYQTAFGDQAGSTEMPSAARGFTQELVEALLNKGVQIVPILLHTGVSSLEIDEHPYPEYAEVSALSSQQINLAKRNGKRIIAVGTTVVRALESAADEHGTLHSFRGLTAIYIQANYKMKIATGLLTGFHEPRASHLHMLQALASKRHLRQAYTAALNEQYYWHEFGDLHLILTDEPKKKWTIAPELLAKPIDWPRRV